MIKESKCLEFYLDSKDYGNKEIQEKIEETKKEFPDKTTDVRIILNDFGMYVITINFKNKYDFLSGLKRTSKEQKIRRKKIFTMSNKKIKQDKKYGQYKQTGTFRPY